MTGKGTRYYDSAFVKEDDYVQCTPWLDGCQAVGSSVVRIASHEGSFLKGVPHGPGTSMCCLNSTGTCLLNCVPNCKWTH